MILASRLLHRFAPVVLVSCIAVSTNGAQAIALKTPANSASTVDSLAGGTPRRFVKQFAYGVWIAESFDARTASHNESISGGVGMIAVRIQREVPFKLPVGLRVSYVGELLPFIFVTSAAPSERIPVPAHPGETIPNADQYARRKSYGAGISPLGAEAMWPLSKSLNAIANATVGGEWFSKIVPYGNATRANFTFTPGVALEWRVGEKSTMTIGYKLHHLSNASFGGSNPGINAQMVSLSLSRVGYR